ncbi:MAG: RNA methyltransferase [bacterium]|nr:RNA methyltransferase [bacterium]MDY4979127.1 RNA methyltransferase [Candidatus Onthovivens sp.]
MIKTITSNTNEFIKYLNKLKDTSFSKKENKALIEGEHLVNEAKDYLLAILTLKEIKGLEIDQYIVTEEILKKLSSGKSFSKIIGLISLKKEEPIKSNVLIYLNRVQDPGNVGTIFRTSLAFSYFDILIDEGSSHKYNPKVIQASQGSIFKLNIINSDYSHLISLKKEGYKIIVTALNNNSIYLKDFKLKDNEKYVIVFGNEGQGVSKEIIDIADYVLKIDINNIDSLNVAIASGIILYSLKK